MSKKTRRRKKIKQARRPKNQIVMTQQKIDDVADWLYRMGLNTTRAIKLSEQLTVDSLSEDDHLYWALVKYVENVQESAKQINNINSRFFSELAEIDKDDWKALRGMREWLAHKFWDVDSNILWKTVKEDFASLLPLLESIRIADKLFSEKGEIDLTDELERIKNMPEMPEGFDFKPGHSLVIMAFTRVGDIMVVRIGHSDGQLTIITDKHTTPKTYFRPSTSPPPS